MSIQDQPPPKPTNRTPAWGLVREYLTDNYEGLSVDKLLRDMYDRDQVGRQRYGTPLTADNGRDHLIDAYLEQLDYAVYLRAWLDEHGINPDGLKMPTRDLTRKETLVVGLFKDSIEVLIDMKEILL